MKFSSLTYAGHSAVFVNTEDATIGVDPWLEGNPRCPENLKNPDRLDLIVLTHGHADHASDTVRLAKHYGSRVAATYELAMILISEGIPAEHVIPMNKGGTTSWEGITVTLTNAFHSSSYDTAEGPVYAGEACGVVLDDGHTPIYHAGDTCLFSDMEEIRELHAPKVALLPIGDCFTMGPKEAAAAADLIGAPVVIPVHYLTFDLLTGTAEEFRKHCGAGREVVEIEPGDSYTIG